MDKNGLNIKEVSDIIDVTPTTIRNWEKYQLFVARRRNNGYRYYDKSDVEFLSLIKQYMIEDRLSIENTKIIMSRFHDQNKRYSNSAFNRSGEYSNYEDDISNNKWKLLREKSGLSLEEVSKAVGISTYCLDKIENKNENVPKEKMVLLAHFYGESLISFTDNDNSIISHSHIRQGDEKLIDLGLVRTKAFQLSSLKDRLMHPTVFLVNPGGHSPRTHNHRGEEFIYVMQGKIDLYLNNKEKHTLETYDSCSFKGSTNHYWENTTEETAVLLWVHCSIDN